ncbi:unnamed protein product [Rotaria magnacalcarata]|uniref:Uncharacterized protein n=1 Tax=Rotaria magnacalcarata TaxID=392030 RepID=A0A8S2MH25_9BILA|nr:unnamed protein product [Rotaria magnacalcarata]
MFLFTLSICSYIPVVKTFNLDIISPTLRTGPPKSLFGFAVVSSSTKQHWTYVGAPRAFLTRQSSSVVALNSTEIIPNGRIFGNIFECPNGTDECRPILLENQLSEAMPSFHNVLDDAWLGSSLIATSDDSLVTCGYRLMRNISIDRYDTRGGCYKVSSDHQDVSYYDFCEQNSETELLHEGSALCQSGLSLAYIPSGGRSDIIAFGEPGAFQWSGRIEADYSDTVLRQLYAYKSASSTPLPYSYLGYSVLIIKSKTRDFNDRSYIFVASAPRASNGLGEIRFYIKRFVSTNNFGYDTLQSIFQLNNTNHSIPFILTGEQIGSYFGHTMTAGDLNGDGYTDLVVSAPFYYSKKPSHGGAVYIYYGLNGKYTQKIVPSQLLINSKQTTIINDFGFSLATQSPFKSSILSSSIVSSNSTILIYYPSLIIGIPKADMIVHLKSHPLVNVNVRIENMKELQSIRYSAENRRCKTIDGTPVVCFDVRLCFESNDKLAQNLIIIYTLTADALSTIRRILSTVNHLPTITNKQILNTCENQTFITKSGNDDFLTPIHFSLVYNISQDRNDLRGKPFILEGNIPMINATDEERTKKFQANFYKGCGNDDKCITDLQLTAEFINGQKTLNLSVLGIDSEIRIRLNLSNVPSEPSRRKADPAFGTKIDVYFPTSFVQFSQAIMDDKSYSCQPIHRNHVRCKMTDFFNNPFPPEKYSITELVFTLSNVSLSNILRFEFNSTTLTDEKNLDNNNVTLVAKVLLKTDLNLRAGHEPEQVSVSGEGTLGLSSIKNLDQFGMEVTHIYTTITLIENYFDGYDRVDIQSFASIHINDLLVFQTSTDNDNATATTPAEFANRSDKIIVPRLPLWVPLVGAMAGLILLVFIVIVCCLLGFFQRTKAPPLKKKSTALTLDGTTTNSSSDEHQRILLRQTYRQPMLIPSSTTNSFNDENYHSQQTTIPLIHSIPEVPSADNHDQDIDEDEEDDELIQNNLGNQSDIDEEARFPVEDDDDEYSSKMNERLVDTESINHSLK